MTEFNLESYGLADDRVLRYLNGAIIKETPIQHYFTLLERNWRENAELGAEGGVAGLEPDSTVVNLGESSTHGELKPEDPNFKLKKEEFRVEEVPEEAREEPKPVKRRGRGAVKREKKEEPPKEEPVSKEDLGEGVSEEEKVDVAELERLNCLNWNMVASTICMASTLDFQKELPLEWEESKLDQANGYATLGKLKAVFDNLSSKKLDLSHTITRHESKTLKYSIFNRNEKLQEMSEKSLEMSERILKSLKLQLKYLEIIRTIKQEFKVMVSHRNPVDLTSLDVDFPASFSTNILFYDVYYSLRNDLFDYSVFHHKVEGELGEFTGSGGPTDHGANYQTPNSGKNSLDRLTDPYKFSDDVARDDFVDVKELLADDQENVWDMWEDHVTSPFAPQMCLISYYESDDLLTRMTFPQSVSHFIEKDYQLSINGATIPLYPSSAVGSRDNVDTERIMTHLRRARACLIDRFIFLVLCQFCYKSVKAGKYFIRVGDSTVFIKYISSKSLSLVLENVDLVTSYESMNLLANTKLEEDKSRTKGGKGRKSKEPSKGGKVAEERGETVWKLLITKLRDSHIRNWKAQKFQLQKNTENPLEEFLKYAIKLIRYRRSRQVA